VTWANPPERNAIGAVYEKIMANRAIHLGAHLVVIAVIGCVYELRNTDPHFVYWLRGSGFAVALSIGSLVWPFIVSAVITRQYVSAHRPALMAYVLTTVGCAAVSVAALGLPSFRGAVGLELPLTIVQMFVLMNASARFLQPHAF
jgi:hypothetical protein